MDVSEMIESHTVELEEFEKQFLNGNLSEQEISIKSQYFNFTVPMVQELSELFTNCKKDEESEYRQHLIGFH